MWLQALSPCDSAICGSLELEPSQSKYLSGSEEVGGGGETRRWSSSRGRRWRRRRVRVAVLVARYVGAEAIDGDARVKAAAEGHGEGDRQEASGRPRAAWRTRDRTTEL